MITFFATPKPFRGHIGIIQRNAIESWKRIHPDAEVILFGDEEGAAEAAHELGIRHVPEVARNEHGTPYLNDLFDSAQTIARHELLCFLNCDILLLSDFREAVNRIEPMYRRFLMLGRRWDVGIVEPLNFASADWERSLRQFAIVSDHRRPPQWIDYFVFPRGLYRGQILPFAIGRPGYDNWLIWKTRRLRAPVIDASEVVVAPHQNHDYSHHKNGEKGFWEGEEAQANSRLLGSWRHFNTIEDATHRLTSAGLRRSFRHWTAVFQRAAGAARNSIWFGFLDLTRAFRHRVGLRQT